MQTDCRPDRGQRRSQRGGEDRLLAGLQQGRVGGVPPHHQVSVGSKGEGVVPAPHGDAGRRLCGDEGELSREVGRRELLAEHRPAGLADGAVGLVGVRDRGHRQLLRYRHDRQLTA